MFKVNSKDTRTYFTPCSSVSIVNFEQVNAGWVKEKRSSDQATDDINMISYNFMMHQKGALNTFNLRKSTTV